MIRAYTTLRREVMQQTEAFGTDAASAAFATAAAKTMPAITVSGLTLAGIQLQDWVYIATLAWIAVQVCGYLWDRFGPKRKGRR